MYKIKYIETNEVIFIESCKNIKTCVEDYFNNFLTLQITFVPPIPNTYSICRKRFWSSLKGKTELQSLSSA